MILNNNLPLSAPESVVETVPVRPLLDMGQEQVHQEGGGEKLGQSSGEGVAKLV